MPKFRRPFRGYSYAGKNRGCWVVDGVVLELEKDDPRRARGQRFDSKREAKRWLLLDLWHREGVIDLLRRQVRFEIVVNGVPICTYVADYTYMRDGVYVVEDAKGFLTPEYELKKKLMLATRGISIQEV